LKSNFKNIQTILGSSGSISIPLAKHLTQYTDKIRLVSRNPKKVNTSDELMGGDLLDAYFVDKAVEGSDIVYLTAGLPYKADIWAVQWPILMKNVIDACIKHNAKLVFFDNVYALGYVKGNITEQCPIKLSSKKGEVRAQVVNMILNAHLEQKLDYIIARAADFYGPNVPLSVMDTTVVQNIKNGKKAQWFCDSSKIHSFTHVNDAAKGTAILGNTPTAFYQVWILPTSSEKLNMNHFVEMLSNKADKKNKGVTNLGPGMLTIIGLFVPVLKEFKEMLYQYDNDYFFDSSKFNNTFNYNPKSYSEGVKEIVSSF
jgi:nucleoside-diphosphate-sugar epimerase